MVFVVLLAIVDLLCAISLGAYALGFPLLAMHSIAAVLLLAKGIFFLPEPISILDVIIAIAMFALLWFSLPMLALAMAIYLGIKGLSSFS